MQSKLTKVKGNSKEKGLIYRNYNCLNRQVFHQVRSVIRDGGAGFRCPGGGRGGRR